MNKDIFSDELTLTEIFGVLKKHWKLISICTFIFSLVSIIYSLTLYNQYKSSALLVPNSLTASIQSESLGFNGGLSSLAGVNLGNGGSNEVLIALNVLESQKFLTDFAYKYDIVVDLMAAKGWNKKTNNIILDNKIYNTNTKSWLDGPPSDFEIFESFIERIKISQDKDTSLVYISIEYYSPYIAVKWLDLIIYEINEYMRKRKLEITYKNLDNLQESFAATKFKATSDSITRLIYEQERIKMISETASEYIFEVVNSPVLPEKKSKPSRSIIVIIASLMGFILSAFWILLRNNNNKNS